MDTDARLIREILARECDTVNLYEELAERAQGEETRSLILHFAREEKEHVSECARFLARLDLEYAALQERPLEHALEEEPSPGEGGGASPERQPAAAAEAPAPERVSGVVPWSFTVGSLIERGGSEAR